MTEHPAYVSLPPPCNFTCPAGEDIQGWMAHASRGDYRNAWRLLVQHNPLPAVTGRVCYHPCETNCNRCGFDEAVNIHAVERFIGDESIRQGWTFHPAPSPTGKRVLIVGAGPAGVTAAYHLRRFGHAVTIADASPHPGGLLRYGIPRFRLPRNVLDAELCRILDLGVTLLRDTKIEDFDGVRREFDALLIAAGVKITKRTQDLLKSREAIELLASFEAGVTPGLGSRVLVYGGGNTALDVARTAKRLGASDTLIVYHRTREKMPAQPFEVDEPLLEGITFRWLSTIVAASDDSVTLERMRLDDSGRAQPTGEYDLIAGGTLLLALGQDVDPQLLDYTKIDERMMTGTPGIFAAGDVVATDRTVTAAIGHGKKAAQNIDAYLRGASYQAAPKRPVASFERLNLRTTPHTARASQPQLDLESRLTTFDEINGPLNEPAARAEAVRCLSCGNCHQCDNCYQVCPGEAVVKLGVQGRYEFNYENCDGCGLCAAECPCGAIEMVN